MNNNRHTSGVRDVPSKYPAREIERGGGAVKKCNAVRNHRKLIRSNCSAVESAKEGGEGRAVGVSFLRVWSAGRKSAGNRCSAASSFLLVCCCCGCCWCEAVGACETGDIFDVLMWGSTTSGSVSSGASGAKHGGLFRPPKPADGDPFSRAITRRRPNSSSLSPTSAGPLLLPSHCRQSASSCTMDRAMSISSLISPTSTLFDVTADACQPHTHTHTHT